MALSFIPPHGKSKFDPVKTLCINPYRTVKWTGLALNFGRVHSQFQGFQDVRKPAIWPLTLSLPQDHGEYLDTVNKSGIMIHGTVYQDMSTDKPLQNIPLYVINHGILNGEDLHTLLRRSKVSPITLHWRDSFYTPLH